MSENVTIARPYAEAAFSLAREQNALPRWAGMLGLLSNVTSDPTVRAALDNPRLDNAAKESLLLSLCGDALDADGRSFVRVLLESDRVAVLPDIKILFDTLKDGADGVARAQIVSAFPVDDAQLASLKAALEKRFGKKIEATVSVDPDLIGGARVTVGDTVIDASVRGELQAMSSQLRV
jgi:F-type H+-transporting ATPase subunit delta